MKSGFYIFSYSIDNSDKQSASIILPNIESDEDDNEEYSGCELTIKRILKNIYKIDTVDRIDIENIRFISVLRFDHIKNNKRRMYDLCTYLCRVFIYNKNTLTWIMREYKKPNTNIVNSLLYERVKVYLIGNKFTKIYLNEDKRNEIKNSIENIYMIPNIDIHYFMNQYNGSIDYENLKYIVSLCAKNTKIVFLLDDEIPIGEIINICDFDLPCDISIYTKSYFKIISCVNKKICIEKVE